MTYYDDGGASVYNETNADACVPELLKVVPELVPLHNESADLRAKLAEQRSKLLAAGFSSGKCPWDVFVRAVVEVGKLTPQQIGFATGASPSSVSRWLAGKVQPLEDMKSEFAYKMIGAIATTKT